MNKEYAIVCPDGNYLVGTTLGGNEPVIYLMTKDEASAQISRFYTTKHKVKKIIHSNR